MLTTISSCLRRSFSAIEAMSSSSVIPNLAAISAPLIVGDSSSSDMRATLLPPVGDGSTAPARSLVGAWPDVPSPRRRRGAMICGAMGATQCEYCGGAMPADADPRAVPCSTLCTWRANSGVPPPGERVCACDAPIVPSERANKRYCSQRAGKHRWRERHGH